MLDGQEVMKEGDWITLNGTKGYVYLGQLPMKKAAEDNPDFMEFMKLCQAVKKIGVRTNARPRRRRPRAFLRRRRYRPVPHRAHVLRQKLGTAAFSYSGK